MPFWRVNGWAIPIIEGSAREEHQIGGEFARTFSGSRFSDEHYDKRMWRGRTPPLTEMEAKAVQGAVRGLGHVWNFNYTDLSAGTENLDSSKGIVTTSTPKQLRWGKGTDGSTLYNKFGNPESISGNGSLAVEPATTNILSANQRDVETGTSGFTALGGASLGTDTTNYVQGVQSLRVTNSASGDGVETDDAAASASTQYAFSAYVRCDSAITIRIQGWGDVNGNLGFDDVSITAGQWWRIWTIKSSGPGENNVRIRLTNQTDGSDFSVDALQIEQQAHATTWADPSRVAFDNDSNPKVFGDRDWTVNLWYKAHSVSTSQNRLFYAWNADFTIYTLILRFADDLQFWWRNGDDGPITLTLTNPGWADDWHMLTMVSRRNPETGENALEVYRNGVSALTNATAAAIPKGSDMTVLQLGHGIDVLPIGPGLLDDFMVVPYAAPAAQILGWYNLTAGIPALSKFYFDGDIHQDNTETILCEGDARISQYVGAHKGGEFKNNLRTVELEVWEV